MKTEKIQSIEVRSVTETISSCNACGRSGYLKRSEPGQSEYTYHKVLPLAEQRIKVGSCTTITNFCHDCLRTLAVEIEVYLATWHAGN